MEIIENQLNTLETIITSFDKKSKTNTLKEFKEIEGEEIPYYVNEFWTSKQRQSNSIHEISYRACFKSELPNFFITRFSKEGDVVYDPFSGRGTTIVEAALLGRNIISNDINPLNKILAKPRINPPSLVQIQERLKEIPFSKNHTVEIELDVFFHNKTLQEILSLRAYFSQQKKEQKFDFIDEWIQMVATNRLTGHSAGFFSVYTLPPNQAITIERQKKINMERNQQPEYRDVKELILKKSKALLKDIGIFEKFNLENSFRNSLFINELAQNTPQIKNDSIDLIITSPPFLDVIKYDDDNWLRCWFNNIDIEAVGKNITMSKKIEEWESTMSAVFSELFRITKTNGMIAFEVGEVKNGKIKLDEIVIKIGQKTGFNCLGVIINEQEFSKTSNIWGVNNNKKGTNTNRIVILKK